MTSYRLKQERIYDDFPANIGPTTISRDIFAAEANEKELQI
jgi:hypothetical protein